MSDKTSNPAGETFVAGGPMMVPAHSDFGAFQGGTTMTTTIGEDPVADSRNGEYVIVKPPSWSQARWDAYQRGLGGAPR